MTAPKRTTITSPENGVSPVSANSGEGQRDPKGAEGEQLSEPLMTLAFRFVQEVSSFVATEQSTKESDALASLME
jgi:hypothetical protein